jgi:hypothetical protein
MLLFWQTFSRISANSILKYCKINPAGCYMSAPQMFWDAMLKFTGVKLDVMVDHDMYLIWERHLRGGTTFLNEHYATANNKYIQRFH